MKVKEKNTFDSLKIFIFFTYNVAYVLYMLGHISRWINLAILAVFISLCAYQYLYRIKKSSTNKKTLFLSEFKYAIVIVISFFIISIIIQIIHGSFGKYLFNELLYNLIPPIIAFFWINSTDKERVKPYFYIFFARAVLYFLLKNGAYLSIENIMSITWDNSKSSIFETTLAHDFVFLEIIFLYFKNHKLAIASALLCLLSFKRISFILCVLILLGYYICLIRKNGISFMNKEVSKKIRIIVLIIFCVMPLALNWIVSDSGVRFFYNKGIDINQFTTGRVNLVRFVNNNIGEYNGYGSSDHFLENYTIEKYSKLGNMHCDMLKLYYEVTILGVIVYAYSMISFAKKNRIVFLMLLYIIMELFSSHFLDVLSVWNMFFMFAAYIYSHGNENRNNLEGLQFSNEITFEGE